MVCDTPDTAQDVSEDGANHDIVCDSAEGKVNHTDAQIVCQQDIEGIFPRESAAVGKLHEVKGGQRGDQQEDAQKDLIAGEVLFEKGFNWIHK